MRQLWDARVAESEARVRGVEVNEVDEKNAFAALLRPVRDRFLLSAILVGVLFALLALGVPVAFALLALR